MAKYRQRLPQLDGKIFLSDAGIETTMIFENGFDLPYFAAFHLLQDPAGVDALRSYFIKHLSIALAHGTGFILESATWRASIDWGKKLGYSEAGIATANRQAINLLIDLRNAMEADDTPIVISGCIGPRGDGYVPGQLMSADEACRYHQQQAAVLAEAGADLITAITMNNVPEAIGVVRAAEQAGMPVAVGLTVETDGLLPTGQPLHDAICEIDATTNGRPVYYMINCAHPTHFAQVLTDADWTFRLRGIRANASRCSHVELDNAPELDRGDPVEFGRQYAELRVRFPQLNVFGGCCGTDHQHIQQIALACVA